MHYISYKALHIISIVALIVSFGLIIIGCAFQGKELLRKIGFIFHGISWLAVFWTAFGLVGALNMHANFPAWAKGKTVLLVLLGLGAFMIKKRPQWIGIHSLIIFLICSAAVTLAVFKPNF